MSAPMTRADRETLIKIVRQRERLAKTDATERAARLVSDFELQLDREFSYDENEIWLEATTAAKAAVAAAQAQIEAECERLGIPKEFAPGLSFGWHGRGQNAVSNRRGELRRIAKRQIEAAEKSARTTIERKTVETQEKLMAGGLGTEEARLFLEAMPTAEALMPLLAVAEVRQLLPGPREDIYGF